MSKGTNKLEGSEGRQARSVFPYCLKSSVADELSYRGAPVFSPWEFYVTFIQGRAAKRKIPRPRFHS